MSITKINLNIKGMSCASCVAHIEAALQGVAGVTQVQVNLATNSAYVTANGTASDLLASLVTVVKKAGYEAQLKPDNITALASGDEETASSWKSFFPVFLALFLSMPLVLPMIFLPFGWNFHLPIWLQFILATPVQFILGAKFYRGAYRALIARTGNMDLLVALGTTAGWLLSVGLWWRADKEGMIASTYFEASSVVVALILLGKWLEDAAKARSGSAVRALCALQPSVAHRWCNGVEEDVPISELVAGDVIVIKSGECIPADGIVQEGSSSVDESMLTGEPMPVDKAAGDKLSTGTLNGMGRLQMRVNAVGEGTALASIIRLVEEAQSSKAPIQRVVDKVSSVFVPIVILIAAATFLVWYFALGTLFSIALIHAVTVLVVACPCAMGLATPVAIISGTGRAAKSGILITNVQALENTCQLKTIVFDKTGTLTIGKPKVTNFSCVEPSKKPHWVAVAVALQSGSAHPLAQAVLDFAKQENNQIHLASSDVKTIVGCGTQGTVNQSTYVLGKLDWVEDLGVQLTSVQGAIDELIQKGCTLSVLAEKMPSGIYELRALLGFNDEPKKEAREILSQLRAMGLHLVMLSGDNQAAALHMGDLLGFDLQHDTIVANLMPEDKVKHVQALQTGANWVAMVGDGVNDSPALASATVGIAMGTGADVAMHAADITIMRGDLRLIPAAITISKKTVSKIHSNLFWAFFYNVVGVPLAAFGVFSPVIAGAAMALSSVSVLANALLLQRWRDIKE